MINSSLEELYLSDKHDRELLENGSIQEKDLHGNDIKRLISLAKILHTIDENEIWNCHYVAYLLMHFNKPEDYKLAHNYAKKAIDLGSNVTKWLYAASLDR